MKGRTTENKNILTKQTTRKQKISCRFIDKRGRIIIRSMILSHNSRLKSFREGINLQVRGKNSNQETEKSQ
jgi:hypothetical protein